MATPRQSKWVNDWACAHHFLPFVFQLVKRISLITETNLKQEKGKPKVNLTTLAVLKAIRVSVWQKNTHTHTQPLKEYKSKGFWACMKHQVCYRYMPSLGVPSSFFILAYWYEVSLCSPGWPGTQTLSVLTSWKPWLLVYATTPRNSSSVRMSFYVQDHLRFYNWSDLRFKILATCLQIIWCIKICIQPC